jgi:hypothetical protein
VIVSSVGPPTFAVKVAVLPVPEDRMNVKEVDDVEAPFAIVKVVVERLDVPARHQIDRDAATGVRHRVAELVLERDARGDRPGPAFPIPLSAPSPDEMHKRFPTAPVYVNAGVGCCVMPVRPIPAREAAFTVIALWVPVIVPVTVSVAVIDWVPAVLSVSDRTVVLAAIADLRIGDRRRRLRR